LQIIVWFTVIVGGILGILHLTVVELWTVPGDDPLLAASIQPTLRAGDVVEVTRHGSPARGDLLRCADPDAPGRFVIGRAIGHFGEVVEIRREMILIDGRREPSPRACPPVTVRDPRMEEDVDLACGVEDFGDMSFFALRSPDHPEGDLKQTVEADRWFLVSDDRHVHLDSRDYGQIDPRTCGHIVFRLVGAAGFGDQASRLTIIW